ncbi:ShlB/FhaC/HecB family hemolysin secretion/activation protein [Advenella kashmirensis]
MRLLHLIFTFSAFGCIGAPGISAQTLRADILDAQHIQRQQQQQQSLKSRLPSADVTPFIPTISAPDRTHYPAETPCFPITNVTLTGDSAKRFAWALDAALAPGNTTGRLPSPIGQCLGAQGIALLADQVQNRIMAAGYVTSRVMVSSQNIGSGRLTLSLIPGRVHKIRFTDASDSRARRWNALPIRQGDVLNLRDLEQGLETFRRLPTVQADIQIAPASEPGQSDLLINWKQSRPVRLMATLDDAGSKSTGRYQGNVALSLDHLLTLNDLFYASHSRGRHHPCWCSTNL